MNSRPFELEELEIGVLRDSRDLLRKTLEEYKGPRKFRSYDSTLIMRVYEQLHSGADSTDPNFEDYLRLNAANFMSPVTRIEQIIIVSLKSVSEFVEMAISSFECGYASSPLLSLRSLLERFALLHDVRMLVDKLSVKSEDFKYHNVLDNETFNQSLIKALFGTQHNWKMVADTGIREVSRRGIRRDLGMHEVNGFPMNILTRLDKLNKEVSGSSVAYEILSDFAHPNVGDFFSQRTAVKRFLDNRQSLMVRSDFSAGSLSFSGLGEMRHILNEIFEVLLDCSKVYQRDIESLTYSSVLLKVLAIEYVHNLVFNSNGLFSITHDCPCMSGLAVGQCAYRKQPC